MTITDARISELAACDPDSGGWTRAGVECIELARMVISLRLMNSRGPLLEQERHPWAKGEPLWAVPNSKKESPSRWVKATWCGWEVRTHEESPVVIKAPRGLRGRKDVVVFIDTETVSVYEPA